MKNEVCRGSFSIFRQAGWPVVILAAVMTAPAATPQPQMTITQLTSTSGCVGGGGSFYPSFDAMGKKVAFASSCDLVPGKNTDGNSELFFMNTDGTGLVQLTNTVGGAGIFNPSIALSGLKIAFASDRDLVAGGNTDGNDEIFTVNVDGTGLVQLTHTTGGNSSCGFPGASHPRFDPKGQKILFSSDRDLIPGGNSDGNDELFMMNANGSGLQQLTHATGGCGSGDGALDSTGTKVLFDSDRDLIPGENSDGNYELFTMNVDGTDLAQLTSSVNPAGYGHLLPWWTPDTKTIVFRGDGADGVSQQVFRMNGDGTGQVQITWQTNGWSAPWGISPDGKTIAVESLADLVPSSNTDLNGEIYMLKLRP